jgi:glycosyltransferase involved in cell wall biosynthesis
VDGGSTDGTLVVLDKWKTRLPLRVLVVPGSNISQGRNRAIEAAAGPIIASTDAGVELDRDWLARLLAPFEHWQRTRPNDKPPVACGFFQAAPQTVFELALAAVTLPCAAEVRPDRFLPSSRSVAYVKDAWDEIGGYPEWLDYSEDLVFDLRLRNAGYPFVWVPNALVHFRPRRTIEAFARQYYHYARGDGKADLWRLRHAIRYGTYMTGFAGLIATRRFPVVWLAMLVAAAPYLARPYLRLFLQKGDWTVSDRLQAAALVPLLRLVGDLAKMTGYPAGVLWRHKGRTSPSLSDELMANP